MNCPEDDDTPRAVAVPQSEHPRSPSADAPDWYELLAGVAATTAQETVDREQAFI